MAGIPLTRQQALAWFANWSYDDKATLEAEWDRLGEVTYYRIASGGYLGCADEHGRRVMFVAPGYVWFRRGCEPPNRELPPWNGQPPTPALDQNLMNFQDHPREGALLHVPEPRAIHRF